MAVYESQHIKKVTSIAEAFPHGHRISAAVLEYDSEIDCASVSPDSFQVEGRTINRVYASDSPAKTGQGCNGKYVVIELNIRDENAPLMVTVGEEGQRTTAGMDSKPFEMHPGGGPGGHGPGDHGDPGPGGPGPGGPKGPGPRMDKTVQCENRVCVVQCGPVTCTDGKIIPASTDLVASSQAVAEIADDFIQGEAAGLKYSLFVPKNYDPGKSYPMVIFVADATIQGDNPMIPLLQGNGAISFAAPESQAKHPCFVLAPVVPKHMGVRSDEGKNGVGPLPEMVKNLIGEICSEYSVDKARIYSTGQSLGCILSFAMNIFYPDLYAASYLVAGQWEGTSFTPLAGKKLWMINSDHDMRAFPGMNEICEELTKEGADIYRFSLNAKWPKEQQEEVCREAAASGKSIIYGTFADQSVVPDGIYPSAVSNHMNTWPAAYAIDAVKDWMFEQSLD